MEGNSSRNSFLHCLVAVVSFRALSTANASLFGQSRVSNLRLQTRPPILPALAGSSSKQAKKEVFQGEQCSLSDSAFLLRSGGSGISEGRLKRRGGGLRELECARLGKKSTGSLFLLILMRLVLGLGSLSPLRRTLASYQRSSSALCMMRFSLLASSASSIRYNYFIWAEMIFFQLGLTEQICRGGRLGEIQQAVEPLTGVIDGSGQGVEGGAVLKRYWMVFVIMNMMMSEQQGQLTLDNFNMLSVIGKGSYAKVVLVKRKGEEAERVYAMKILKKKYIQKRKQENHVMTQRNILVGMDHPFIVRLFHSFQNEKKLFFALEYCPGGELFGLLSKKQRLSEEQAKFYAAQIILAIQYLHNKDIIYRDLKPQNILIDEQGYLRLTDFGLSKMDITDNNAYSVCGTPEYLAPEILYKQGHGKPVDWWCLGSLIYEMVVGLPPFYSKSRPELFDKIKFSNPNIPPYATHKLRNLLQSLFQKKPEARLGTKGGAAEIKAHPWFDGMNWQALLQKKLKAPFVPLVKSYSDVSHFDPEFTQSEVESYSQASLKSEDGKQYFGFSFDKSKEDKMELEEAGELQLNIKEEKMIDEA